MRDIRGVLRERIARWIYMAPCEMNYAELRINYTKLRKLMKIMRN